MSTIVMKFGGASVAEPGHFHRIAEIIKKRLESVDQIIVVVSAMANTTNMLIQMAKEVNPEPPLREYDMLVTVGERISIALLAMALAKIDVPAVSFTGSQSGIITSEDHSFAKIVDVRPHRLLPHLQAGRVAIVAGFQGCSTKGEITTLGRNGSDISAVAMAAAVQADAVEFYKDVGGFFDSDPKINPKAKRLDRLTYEEALQVIQLGGKILHPRCIELAKMNGVPLHILSFDSQKEGASVIEEPSHFRPVKPLFEEVCCAIS